MRSILFVLACLVLLSVVCGALAADMKVVISDPNADGKITAKIYAETDNRLSQKVSYEARLRTVQEIIVDLREMTGVTLIAGSRESDWPVRSRKMNIFVKDVPLCDLMDSMSRVMKFRWSRHDDIKPYTYRLKVNSKAAAEADAMMKRAEKEQEKIWQQRRQDWLAAIEKYGGKSAPELISLRDTDPQVYEQALLGSLQAAYAIFEEVPEARDRFLAGRNFRISTDQLNPETKRLCFNAGNEFWKHLQRIGYIGAKTQEPAGYGDVLRETDHFDVVYKRLDVGTFTPNLRWGSASVSDTGYWHLMKDGRDFEINGFRYLGTSWNRSIARSNILINENVDVDEVRKSDTDRVTTFNDRYEDSKKLEEYLYPSEPLVEHTSFPQLEQKIAIKIEKPKPEDNPMMALGNRIASIQKALSEASGLSVVSDSWLNLRVGKLSLDEAKLGELLDKLCTELNYNWDKPGPILEFRYRKWAKMRLNQIPDEWVSEWSANTQEHGYLSLDDLAGISNLSYYQAEETVRQDPVVGMMGIYGRMIEILDDNLPWLRFYASLKPQQRALLTGERGLNGLTLTSAQWQLAQPMFDRIGLTRGDALMRSGITVGEDPRKINVWFEEIDTDSGEMDRMWKFDLPQYTPPKPAADATSSQ